MKRTVINLALAVILIALIAGTVTEVHKRHGHPETSQKKLTTSYTFARFVENPTSRGMLLPKKHVEDRLAIKTIKQGTE